MNNLGNWLFYYLGTLNINNYFFVSGALFCNFMKGNRLINYSPGDRELIDQPVLC